MIQTLFSSTGTRTQVVRVKAEYPDQLDHRGFYITVGSRVYLFTRTLLTFQRS